MMTSLRLPDADTAASITLPAQAMADVVQVAAQLGAAPIASLALGAPGEMAVRAYVADGGPPPAGLIAFYCQMPPGNDWMIIPETLASPGFSETSFVRGEPYVRFFASIPLFSQAYGRIGFLSVMDVVPRGIDSAQREALDALARQVVLLWELAAREAGRKHALLTKACSADLLAATCSGDEGLTLSRKAWATMEVRYRNLFESAKCGVLVVGADTGRIQDANPFILELLGSAPQEIIGKALWDIGLPENAAAAETRFGALMETGYARYEDLPLQTKQGQVCPVEFICNIYGSGDGKLVQCFIRDITERKKAEEQLHSCMANLERSNGELESFAYVASHDLQEPLRKIQAFGERLKVKCAHTLPPEGVDYVERMQKSASRMQVLIHDLLAFSIIKSECLPFVPVALGVVVEDVLSDLQPVLDGSSVRVEVGPLPTILGDALQLRLLLQNLLSNAIKFHRKSHPRLVKVYAELHPDESPLKETLLPIPGCSGSAYCLIVEDNGIGFDEKYLDRVFTIFQRLHGRSEYEGAGIGLAICRRIAEHHGGSITAHSKPGQGTAFKVTLPCQIQGETD